MKIDADAVLKLSLAAAAIVAGSGVGYYYGIFLPDQAREAQARVSAATAAEAEAQQKAVRDRVRAEQGRQQAYQDCVSMAELDYRNRWNTSCRAQRNRDEAALADCQDDLFRTDAGCAADHPLHATRECELPGDAAATYAQDLDRAKAVCLQTFQSAGGQLGSGQAGSAQAEPVLPPAGG